MLKKYMIFIAILIGISIVLGMSYSNFIVASENHKVAEMYIGTLKYSMSIDGTNTNTLSVPSGETIIDVTITNENPIDTYYKLIYQNNSNISIKYYESTKDTNDNVTNYSSPNSKITSNNTNTIKLKITNSSTSSQKVTFKIVGGFATNTLNDVTVPTGYTIINTVETPSTNTYFCTTTDTLTQGLKYVNGQYTYAYKQEGAFASSGLAWNNISNNGWGVQLTDKTSTNAVTSSLCTYINNKPISSMSNMFVYSQATSIDLSNFDTSNVKSMNSMFYRSQTELLNLSSFDTSNVTDMSWMFSDSQATTLDVSGFNTSNVTDMCDMFAGTKVKTLNLSGFNTSNVTNMSGMFADTSLTSLDVSNFNTSKVTDMGSMFSGGEFTILDLSNFDTSNVANMGGMFIDSQVKTLDLSNFDTSNVTEMWRMFDGAQATKIVLSSFNTSNVTNMYQMFSKSHVNNLDLSNFNTSKVTDMNRMFWSTYATTIDVSSFDTSKVTDMNSMFYGGDNLKTIYASSKFVTTAVSDSEVMFEGSTSLVGGSGTKYNSSYTDKTYARIDGGTSSPGYFTSIPEPNSFSTDSWMTIAKAVKSGNISKYNVGNTKTIDMGTYGTHTVRIANKSTPSECNTDGFSQTACGFVIEFADIIVNHKMNNKAVNTGGWNNSAMRTFLNADIYSLLPDGLKSGIANTTVVTGGGSNEKGSNLVSVDKLYLLAPKEIFNDFSDTMDAGINATRQLDYYKSTGTTLSSKTAAIKKLNGTAKTYWLRTSVSTSTSSFIRLGSGGTYSSYSASGLYGTSPAFRIG